MSGYKGSRTVSRLLLKSVSRCPAECFGMAGLAALLRFVNC